MLMVLRKKGSVFTHYDMGPRFAWLVVVVEGGGGGSGGGIEIERKRLA